MNSVEFHIVVKPVSENDVGPQIVFGFAGQTFSQAVYLDAPTNAGDAVQMADKLYKSFLEACGASVRNWQMKVDAETEAAKLDG